MENTEESRMNTENNYKLSVSFREKSRVLRVRPFTFHVETRKPGRRDHTLPCGEVNLPSGLLSPWCRGRRANDAAPAHVRRSVQAACDMRGTLMRASLVSGQIQAVDRAIWANPQADNERDNSA